MEYRLNSTEHLSGVRDSRCAKASIELKDQEKEEVLGGAGRICEVGTGVSCQTIEDFSSNDPRFWRIRNLNINK